MIVRTALLLAAGLMLGSCCLSGNCYGPVAGAPASAASASMVSAAPAGAPMTSAPTASAPMAGVTSSAPDGLSSAQDDEPQADAPPKPRKTARRSDIAVEPLGDASASARRRRGDTYEEQQAADLADEARLKRKLIICQNCSSSGN
jgi:hypothetical protein